HPVAGVGFLADVVGIKRLEIAGPAAARIELGIGCEERRSASHAAVDAGFGRVPVAAGERALGAFLARHDVFLGGQLRAPLRVGFLNLVYVSTCKGCSMIFNMLIDFPMRQKSQGNRSSLSAVYAGNTLKDFVSLFVHNSRTCAKLLEP